MADNENDSLEKKIKAEYLKHEDQTHLRATREPRSNAHRIKAMLHMAALGLTTRQIANQLGLHPNRVNAVIKSQSGQAEIEKIQQRLYVQDAQKMFMGILPNAVKTAKKIMNNKKEKGSTRADVAFRFMDRALGKPVQQIQHEGSTISQLFELLDKRTRAPEPKTIDTTSRHLEAERIDSRVEAIEQPSKAVSSAEDEIDSMVKEYLGDE